MGFDDREEVGFDDRGDDDVVDVADADGELADAATVLAPTREPTMAITKARIAVMREMEEPTDRVTGDVRSPAAFD